MNRNLQNTRNWVESEIVRLGFGEPHIHWGDGGFFGGHSMTTSIEKGTVTIAYQDLEGESSIVAVAPLW